MSSREAPVLLVARTCIATSSSWPSAASSASVTIERSRFDQSGRDQTLPQALSVISCWNGRSNSVVADSARSTCWSPSTARLTARPV